MAMKRYLRHGLMLLLLFTAISGCKEKVVVPDFEGRYFIDNKTPISIQVQAKDGADFLVLQNSQIAKASIEQIYATDGGSSAGALPTNVFTEFKVFVRTGIKDSVIYQGLNNSDWEVRNSGDDFSEYYLTIQP